MNTEIKLRVYKTGTDIKQESLHSQLPVLVSIPYTSTLKAFPVENSVGWKRMNLALTIPTRLCFTVSFLPSFALKTCKERTLLQIKWYHLTKRIVFNAAVFLLQKLPWQTFRKSSRSYGSRTQFSLRKPNITQPREIVACKPQVCFTRIFFIKQCSP